MKLKLVVLFIALALVSAESEEFCEKEAGACAERMLRAIMEDITKEETCEEIRLMTECWRNVAEECLDEDGDLEVDRRLEELDNWLQQECPVEPNEDDEMSRMRMTIRCVEESQQYLIQCISDAMVEIYLRLGIRWDLGEELWMKNCEFQRVMNICISERALEKCGEDGQRMVEHELYNALPRDILETCFPQHTISMLSLHRILG